MLSVTLMKTGVLLGVAAACFQPAGLLRAQTADAPNALSAALPEAPEFAGGALAMHTAEDRDLPLLKTPQRLAKDQWRILSSPARVSKRDLRWLLPVAGVAVASIATDTRAMQDVVSHDPGINSASDTASGALRDVFIAGPVLMFGAGQYAHNDHLRESGLLAGEAMVNAYVTDEAIKYITLRERPSISNGRGHFFASDAASDPSFVSGHSIVAWSSAAVLASEYTKPWQQVGLYAAASGVSFTRVLAQQHFPSDAVLGAVSGWLIGRYVYSAHHRAFGTPLPQALLLKLMGAPGASAGAP